MSTPGTFLQMELLPTRPPAETVIRHRVNLAGQWIEYEFKRSPRRRRITLTVDHHGLRVLAPWRAPQMHIDSMLGTHAAWILRKLTEWKARVPQPFAWHEGAVIMVMGEPLLLAWAPGRGVSQREGGTLHVASTSNHADDLARHVIGWLRASALACFRHRIAHYAPAMGVTMPAIKLSNARTRWGSCHHDGRVRLNWRLYQMPSELIDYVVVHELAHLHEPNHSPRFWRRVTEVLPDHKIRRRTLRLEGHSYLVE